MVLLQLEVGAERHKRRVFPQWPTTHVQSTGIISRARVYLDRDPYDIIFPLDKKESSLSLVAFKVMHVPNLRVTFLPPEKAVHSPI